MWRTLFACGNSINDLFPKTEIFQLYRTKHSAHRGWAGQAETVQVQPEKKVTLFNPISPGGGGGFRPPWETFRNNFITAQDIKIKFFKLNLTPMGVILLVMTILINLRCCHQQQKFLYDVILTSK